MFPRKAAWAIVLTSTNNYVKGVLALANALTRVNTKYPLLVLHTDGVSLKAQEQLRKAGCDLRAIQPVLPRGKADYMYQRYIDTWTKLVVWDQEDYDRLVLLDADMLPLRNMDELMTMDLPDADTIAACHACTCNPQKIASYPPDWTPESCTYTVNPELRPSACTRRYFNSGLIVLTPRRQKFQAIMAQLNAISDLNKYLFPDQDFLNEIFQDRWIELAYIYNALKTLITAHASMWRLENVKNIHYILAKPWDFSPNSVLTGSETIYRELYALWWDAFGSSHEATLAS